MAKEETFGNEIDQEFSEIPKVNFSNCFGCSPNNLHGLKLRFWLSKKGCFTRCIIPAHFCGFDGLAHGGIIATVLDEVAAWVNFVHLQRIGVTLEASVRYLKPVPTDTELHVEGKLIKNNEKKSVITTTLRSSDGAVLAEGTSQWLLPSYLTIAKMTGINELVLQKMIKQIFVPIKQFLDETTLKK